MSRKFRKSYTGFSRDVLSEFMTKEELENLDRRYNEAKIKRLQRRIESELK